MPAKRKASGGGGGGGSGGGSSGGGRDGPGGKRRVRFRKKEESEEDAEESDDSQTRAALRRRRPAASSSRGRGADGSDDDDDDDDEDEGGNGRGVDGKGGGGGGGFGDDEDDEDEVNVDRMVEQVHGEEDEDEHYERTNEAGDPIEPFNLRNERDMGYFDTNGNFVWKREDQERDAWLAEMDEGAMEEAIGAASNRTGNAGAAPGAEGTTPLSADHLSHMSTTEMREALISLLEEDETVVQALRRLGKRSTAKGGGAQKGRPSGAKAGASAQRSKAGSSGRAAAPTSSEVSSAEGKAAGLTREGKQQNGSGDDSGNAKSTEKSDKDMLPDGAAVGEGGSSSDKEAIAAMEKKRREDFGKLTDLADSMLHAGQHDVYHQTREELEESAAAAAEASAVRASTAASYFGGAMGYQHQHQHEHEQGMSAGGEGVEDTAFFEYRGKDGNIHGPYGASQMRGWAQQGYFDGDQAVMMRQILASNANGAAAAEAVEKYASAVAAAAADGGTGDAPATSNADLMADLDDDDEDGEEKTSAAGEGGKGVAAQEEAAGAEQGTADEEWKMSDSIDWSVY